MAGLIDNVMDLARGRLGGGIALDRDAASRWSRSLDQVVAELRPPIRTARSTTHSISTAPVDCDRSRIAQLFSNLLGNALRYGEADKPVTVRASTRDGTFELSVANAGDPIPAAALGRLFQPFCARRRAAEPAGTRPRPLHRVARSRARMAARST